MKQRAILQAMILASLLLLGCGTQVAPPQKVNQSRPVEPSVRPEIKTAKNEVLAILNDPDSARFRDGVSGTIQISPLQSFMRLPSYVKSVRVVCGSVNAKNGFGGYSGYMPYLTIVPRKPFEFRGGHGF